MRDKSKEVSKNSGVSSASQKVVWVRKAGLHGVAQRRFLSTSAKEQPVAFDRRSALRQSLLLIWRADIDQSLRARIDK